jgi:hypothetical protein
MVTWLHALGQNIMAREHVAEEICSLHRREEAESETGGAKGKDVPNNLSLVTYFL